MESCRILPPIAHLYLEQPAIQIISLVDFNDFLWASMSLLIFVIVLVRLNSYLRVSSKLFPVDLIKIGTTCLNKPLFREPGFETS